MKKIFLLLICLLLPISSVFAADVNPTDNLVVNNVHYDHVVWNGIPISFTAPVGQERILKFPSSVTLHNTNPKLTTDKISIENNNGFLYITAKKPFSAVRIPFVIKKTGEVILVDLSAEQNGNDTPVDVVLQTDVSKAPNQGDQAKPQFINYVTLMRYAIQHLYSPERLIDENDAISRTPMYTTRSVNLFNNDNVIAMPLLSWQGGDLYVTAVLLKNTWNQKQILDPRDLNGSWLAASFYPSNFVDPKGSKHDRTTIFLVSDQPFNDALNQVRGYI